MGMAHKTFLAMAKELPRRFLRELFIRKLTEAGVEEPVALAERMAEHVFTNPDGDFEFDEDERYRDIVVELTKEDLDSVLEDTQRFTDEQLPKVIEGSTRATARAIAKDLKARWREFEDARAFDEMAFQALIDSWWSDPIDRMRLLISLSREIGESFLKRSHRSKLRSKTGKNVYRNFVLGRLHARACQVAAEVAALLQAGFADGANARWRTLHELSVVGLLISDNGDAMAERYIAHEAVEHQKAVDTYELTRELRGDRAVPKRETKLVRAAYDAALLKYGRDFAGDYGWASGIGGKGRPSFMDLEKEAGRAGSRSHYKMASYSVHAGQRGISLSLSGPDDMNVLLTGPSNVGLELPGLQAVHSLGLITSLLFNKCLSLDDMTMVRALLQLRDEAERAFVRSGRDLAKMEPIEIDLDF